jgi:hypothetical protein
MTTFTLAARLAALDAASAAATTALNALPPVPQAQAWLDQLNTERDALNATADADKDDVAFRNAAVLWARTVPTAAAVLAALTTDPVYVARAIVPTTTASVALTVATYPNRRSMWGSSPGVTSAMLTELYMEGHRWWLNQPAGTRPPLSDAARPLNDIAVLLPTTIETRFYPPPDAAHPWRVRVRVTPDDISINRHRPLPTSFEVQRMSELRSALAIAPGGPVTMDKFITDNSSGKALWRALCAAVTPARAAWLVATTDGQDLATLPTDDGHHPISVDGFPDRIEVWVSWFGGGAMEQLGFGLPVQRAQLVFELPHNNADAWWNSWTAAVALGVGVECTLPREPSQIEALYVLGLSDEAPAQLFSSKVATGEFAVVEPGTPTSTVDGAPAVDLATDPATWAGLAATRLRAAAAHVPITSEHSGALTGRYDAMGAFPAPDYDPEFLSRTLVGALYPALWGHPLKDIWGLGRDAHSLADWMFTWLRPEGHLLPIRCGDLPYGVLPTTALGRWSLSPVELKVSPELAAVEPALARSVRQIRASLADKARQRGTTVDADATGLTTLVSRTPTAVGYSYTSFASVRSYEQLMAIFPGVPFDTARFEDAVRKRWEPGVNVRRADPQGYYVPFGNVADIGMPLVLPFWFPGMALDQPSDLPLRERVTRLINLIRILQELRGLDNGNLFGTLNGLLPDSLLFRLMIQASVHARADAARSDPATVLNHPGIGGPGDGPQLEPDLNFGRPNLWQWAELLSLSNPGLPPVNLATPAGRPYEIMREAVDALAQLLQDGLDRAAAAGNDEPLLTLLGRLERLFKNTLDTAATRIDPFVTALAWRRLTMLRGESTTRYRLGIYGWVDAPMRGKAGPKPGGLLHAPSEPQAVTSIVLRDRYVAERYFDGAQGQAWQMHITSQGVRMAEEIADEVRMGAHMREALGRRVEAIVNDPMHIRELRLTIAPQRASTPDRFTVCNGERVLELLIQNALPNWVTPDQRSQLQAWADAMDVYADLLVAQGVHHTLARRHDATSGTMDAASGFILPPDLEVVQTPRAGQNVLTSLLVVMPLVAAPAVPPEGAQAQHPAQLADPSVAAYIDATFGPPEDWQWTFNIKGSRAGDALPDGTTAAPIPVNEVRTVSLAGLGLTPMDATLFPPDKLAFAAGQVALDDVTAATPKLISLAVESTTTAPDPQRHRVERELVAVMAGKPFEFHDLHLAGTPASSTELNARDEVIRQDLLARLTALLAAGTALRDGMLADPAQAAAALRLTLRWGIAPIDRTMSVAERVQQASAALDARLQKAQAFVDAAAADAAAPNLAGRAPQVAAGEITAAIKELAAPEGQLAVLSSVDTAQLANYEPTHPIQPAPRLDEDWLTVLAPVRPRLARLEALQLEPLRANSPANFAGLTAYSNRSDDPWQQAAVLENRTRVKLGQAMQPSRLIAAYGPPNVWAGPRVAVGALDNWGETVPEPRHTTQAAFHFNAPGARAPQAVLLAVPPVIDQPLDSATLIDTVRETRELAMARMAAVEDLGNLDNVLPFSMLSTPAPWNDMLLNDSPKMTSF